MEEEWNQEERFDRPARCHAAFHLSDALLCKKGLVSGSTVSSTAASCMASCGKTNSVLGAGYQEVGGQNARGQQAVGQKAGGRVSVDNLLKAYTDLVPTMTDVLSSIHTGTGTTKEAGKAPPPRFRQPTLSLFLQAGKARLPSQIKAAHPFPFLAGGKGSPA